MNILKDFSFKLLARSEFLALLLTGLSAAHANAETSPIHVFGWPVPDLSGDAPQLSLGDDPVVGRQICPPLTRLNLTQQKSEDLLVRRIAESTDSSGSSWAVEVRPGLYWWSGPPVTSEEVQSYLEQNLSRIVGERGAGLWTLPPFKVRSDGPTRVIVEWSQKPVFGPYVLSGAPFYRPKKGDLDSHFRYECVGLYHPKQASDPMVLVPTGAYKSNHEMPEIRLHGREDRLRPRTGRTLEFRSAHSLSPAALGNDPQNLCSLSVELPTATMILWNTKSGLTKSASLRRLLTQLTPRGAIVRAGAGFLADLSASLVPRQHPGYASKLPVRSFDMRGVSESLDQMGYKRRTLGGLRQGPNDQSLELLILTQAASTGLAEKVISDAFVAAGIGVKFATATDQDHPPDGILSSFTFDWPGASLIGNFHSQARDIGPFWALADQALDRRLEDYASSLTMPLPDFSKLIEVQDLLYDLEPATMIFQHRACIISGPGLRPFGKAFTLKDPDWFRQLLF